MHTAAAAVVIANSSREGFPGAKEYALYDYRRGLGYGEEDELRTVPSWKAHVLTGDRKGTWSLFVTKYWRMTFRID